MHGRPTNEGAARIVFGPYHLDLRGEQLMRGTQAIPLRPKNWALLRYLAERPGVLVTKNQLLDAVWTDTVVSEDSLTKSIAEIRDALGDDPKAARFIATVHRRGYRFVAQVSPQSTAGAGAGGPPARTTDGVTASSPAFVGRRAELRQLAEHLDRACRGERQIVFVTGEPGIGKTALIEAFIQSIAASDREEPVWVVRGYSVEQHGAREPYLPVLDAFGRLAVLVDPARLLPLLRRHAPMWLTQLPGLLDPADALALEHALASGRAERMLRECAAFLEAVTAGATLVLVLEDLHWSDPSTVELLFLLAQRREPARLLVIGTYRSAEAFVQEHPLLAMKQTLAQRRQCREMALEYLTQNEVEAYLAFRFPGGSFTKVLAALIHQHSDGNPLFMLAAVDQLIARGWLIETDPGWDLTVPLETLRLGVPDDLRQMIRTQFGVMPPMHRALLETASVAGVEFTAVDLVAAMNADLHEIESACEDLARSHRFLTIAGSAELPNGQTARRYAFVHALYQRVVYEAVPDGRRQRLHQQIGEGLEVTYGDAVAPIAARLAAHFQAAGDAARTIRYLAMAGARAHERFAARETIAYLESALAFLPRLCDADERRRREIELRLPLSSALNVLHGYASDEVRRNCERTRVLCETGGNPAQLYEVTYTLWYSQFVRAEKTTTRQTAERLVALARRVRHRHIAASAQAALGRTALHAGEYQEAHHILGGLLNRRSPRAGSATPIYGADPIVVAHGYDGWALWLLGYPDQGRECQGKGLVLAAELGQPFTHAASLVHAAFLHYLCGDVDKTFSLSDRAVALSTEHGVTLWQSNGSALRGWARVQRGETEAGVCDIHDGLRLYRASGTLLSYAYLLAFLAESDRRRGQFGDGLAAIDEALTLSETTLDRLYEPELWRLKGELLLEQSGVRGWKSKSRNAAPAIDDQIEYCFRRALDFARARGAKSLALRAATSLARLWQHRSRTRAARLLEPLYASFTEGFDTADLRAARALLGELSQG